MSKYLISIVLAIFTIGLNGVPASAGPPDITQCTCNVNPENPAEHGATVTNATSCWSSEYTAREWCSIQIATLEGTGQHEFILSEIQNSYSANGETGTVQYFQELFFGFLIAQSNSETSEFGPFLSAEVSELLALQLPDIVERDQEILERCANALPGMTKYSEELVANSTFGESIYREGQQVFCGVDIDLGWFNIGINLEDFRLVFRAALYDE